MTARLIDGKAISAQVREEVRQAAERILAATGQRPGLAVILVGDSAASQVYVRNKIRACEAAGFHSVSEHLSESTSEADLLALLDRLNHDPAVHGILVQLPLPAHIDTRRVIEAISPVKDVDGFHVANAGALMTGAPQLVPCTPLGVMRLLETTGVPLRGAEAVIVGASNLVGKPQLHLLLQAGATVTLCNSKTRDLAAQTRRADILVVAVGRPRMITADMIKPGAVVIDVGINRLPDGKLAGDVDFESAKDVAGWITPVPGGVGPMTIAMLLQNTITTARRQLGLADISPFPDMTTTSSSGKAVTDTASHASVTDAAANPLLAGPSQLPHFTAIKPEHVSPALDVLLADADRALDHVTAPDTPLTWEGFVLPLQQATERLGHAWGIVQHLNSVMDTPARRETFNQNLPRVVEFWTRLGQNQALFDKYRAFRDSPAHAALDAARQTAIAHEVRDFTLSGAELKSPARERFAAIQEELAALQQKFSENVLDATNAFELLIPDTEEGRARLAGLPDDAVAAARADAERHEKPGWRFTLHFPSYFPVIQYAHDRSLRETMYRAYATRAAEGSAQDNTTLIQQILRLREEKAKLLGLESYAHLSLVPKMADTPAQVEQFLRDMAVRARPFAERDLAELRAFAAERLGLPELQAWDTAYASEALKQKRYAFSDNEVKQYFALPRVLAGLFGLVERLFGVQIGEDQAEGWHPDVRFYRITRNGELLGQFYLDLYAREAKQPGAWMNDCRGRQHENGRLQTPVAYLVCNFQAPVGGQPALLTHDDVTTLFHEFGHGLHHMLTQVDALAVSGISGVEWDAVELPSQFMENWAWEWEIVESMTHHVKTGEPMPKALFDRMLAARNFQAGLQTLRQIEFSLFDMLLHQQAAQALAAGEANPVQRILDAVRQEVAVLLPPAFNRFQNSFSHIFAGGYAAGYYSYKWAEVLSADCYAAFEEEGLFNPAVGQRFLQEILSAGGGRPAIDSFRAFRGRAPELDALLRHNGMVEA